MNTFTDDNRDSVDSCVLPTVSLNVVYALQKIKDDVEFSLSIVKGLQILFLR